MEDLNIRVVDNDHIWINGQQYVSLKRVGEIVHETKCRAYESLMKERKSYDEPSCPFCGCKLSQIREDRDRRYRYCYGCFHEYEVTDE